MSPQEAKFNVKRKWFDDHMRDKKLTQRSLGELMGIQYSAVNLILKGERVLKASEAEIMARAFGVDVMEVLHSAGQLNLQTLVKASSIQKEKSFGPRVEIAPDTTVTGRIDDNGVVHRDGVLGPPKVVAPFGIPSECSVLRFQTSNHMNGWLAYYMPTKGIASDAIDQLCVVSCADGRTMLRHVKRGYGNKDFILTPLTEGESETLVVETAAPVLWLKQR